MTNNASGGRQPATIPPARPLRSGDVEPFLEFTLSVKAVDRELQRRNNEAMAELGITGPQADALVVIGQAGRISLRELGDLVIAEGGHPSRLVDRMVEAGLIERRHADDDRRRIELSLTPSGHRIEQRVLEARAALTELGYQLIPASDLRAALKALRRLVTYTPHAELIARRTRLQEQADAATPAARARRRQARAPSRR